MRTNKIRTVSDLKKVLESIPDDFTIEFNVNCPIPAEELEQSFYGYPNDCTDRIETELEFEDVGYSDKVLKLGASI